MILQGEGREREKGWLHGAGCDCNIEANSWGREDPHCTSGHWWRDVHTGSTGEQLLQSTICIAVIYTVTTDVSALVPHTTTDVSALVPHEYLWWWSWGKIFLGAQFQFWAV